MRTRLPSLMMPALSVLDLAPVAEGSTPAQALHNSITWLEGVT